MVIGCNIHNYGHLSYPVHELLPVRSTETASIKSFRLNTNYMKKRRKVHYLLVCKLCNQNWKQREPFYPFLKKHHKQKHKGCAISAVIVSYLTAEETGEGRLKRYRWTGEYRLVNKDTLSPIDPADIICNGTSSSPSQSSQSNLTSSNKSS